MLWAAMVGKLSQERLDPILSSLIETGELGLSLAGMMLADGLGPESKHDDWMGRFLDVLSWHWPDGADHCLRAWSASRQEKRKALPVFRAAVLEDSS